MKILTILIIALLITSIFTKKKKSKKRKVKKKAEWVVVFESEKCWYDINEMFKAYISHKEL